MNADVHALAGAYALDALPAGEAVAFSAHLEQCTACQQEVAELQATAAQLGLRARQEPPAALRERVLRSAHETRQVPPLIARPDNAATRRRRWARPLAVAAATVLLAGAGVLGLDRVLDDGPREEIARVMEASDARTATAPVRGGGRLTVVSSPELGKAVVLSEDLRPLSPGRVYQLWLVDAAGQARSAEVLIEARRGASAHVVDGVRGSDRIAITREPAGGSEQPTMTPLAVVAQT